MFVSNLGVIMNSELRSSLTGLTLLAAMSVPGVVKAQCMVMSTNVLMPGTMTVLIEKYLSNSYSCMSVATMMNALDCNPGAAGSFTSLLSAEAVTATMDPACSWVCTGCGNVTIDGSDGLPVELLEYSVESAE